MTRVGGEISGESTRSQKSPEPTATTLVAYGALSMPVWIAVIPIVNYLPAFYAQELHLSVGLVGAVFLFARLWDGMADLAVGWLSDHTVSRWGRRKPWVVLGSACLMLCTWFLCNPPNDAGLAYLVLWTVLFYTAWTAVYVPYLSWGAELSSGYVERNRVTSFREAFTMIGNLFFAVAPLIFLSQDAPLRQVLLLIALVVIGLVPVATVLLAIVVHDSLVERTQSQSVRDLVALARDKVLIAFIVAIVLVWTGEGVINSLVVFSFSVGLQLPNKFLWILCIIYIATLSALPLALYLSRRIEKHHLLAGALLVKALGFGAHLWVPAGNFSIVIGLWIVVGIAHAAALVLPTSILADVIDHGDVMDGKRQSGAYVAIYNLAVKIGLALGVGLAFGLLAAMHYDPNSVQHSAADAWNIRVLAFGVPALFEASAIVLLLRHPITKAFHQELRRKIGARATLTSPGREEQMTASDLTA